MSDPEITIDVPPGGPFLVKGLKKLTDATGAAVEVPGDPIALCRCGASGSKPFCDGSHKGVGFTGAKEREESYPVREYAGKELTVVDDIGACCHAGACVRGAPDTFFKWEGDERVSVPDATDRDALIATIRKCPSGSLAYELDGRLHDQFFSDAEIFVSKDGPLHVRGGIALREHTPPTTDHYTLCRCGASKNKPYCDGGHKKAGFKG